MNTERVIYLSEVAAFFKSKFRLIILVGLICFGASFCLALALKLPVYCAEATFRQAPDQMEESGSLQSILKSMQMISKESSTLSLMNSRRLLDKVIEDVGLQIQPAKTNHILSLLKRQFGRLSNDKDFLFREVHYNEEASKTFFIKALSETHFEVLNGKKQLIASGKVGTPFRDAELTFTLVHCPKKSGIERFELLPKRATIIQLKKNLKVKPSRYDSDVLHLTCLHHSRENAMGILNSLMHRYQTHLMEEHEHLAKEQVAYLQRRQKELGHDFDLALDAHVAYLQDALGVEGFLGLSHEVEALSVPKEKYATQKHQLDLEAKKWKQQQLIVKADHPWKEGIEKRNLLEWQQSQIPQGLPTTDEFNGIDLETAQRLYNEYTHDRETLSLQMKQIAAYQDKIDEPDFELSALSHLLQDPVSEKLIENMTELKFQLSDRTNYSEKELKRINEALCAKKKFIVEHLSRKGEILELKLNLTEQKMLSLQRAALELIEKEKHIIDQKLKELAEKMNEIPDRWRLESQLKMKKELIIQIIEGLTQLSESKMVARHLFHVKSKPLDLADAPIQIEHPRLFIFASMGGLVGAVFFFLMLFISSALHGLPISYEFLRDRGYLIAGKPKTPQKELFNRISLDIQKKEVIALIGVEFGVELAQHLEQSGKKILHLLAGRDLDLFHQEILEKIAGWKNEFECILIESQAKLDSTEALATQRLCERFVVTLKEEREEALVPFDRAKTLCVLTK